MRPTTFCAFVAIAASSILSPFARAAMLFSRSTDTIQVAGDISLSTQATYEATVLLNSTTYPNGFGAAIPDGSGLIFNSWEGGVEDKAFTIFNNGVPGALAYPNNQPFGVSGGTVTTGQWYDLAFVIDGSQERMYINGTEVASNNTSQSINNAPGQNVSAVGAIFRDGSINESFLGQIQSLRISNTARYFGSSYTALTGPADFSDDSSTQLLFNFDSAPFGNTFPDLSGHNHTGTIGAGFGGATSPTFVPEPSSLLFFSIAAAAAFRRRPHQKA